jgi:hypothetical protein
MMWHWGGGDIVWTLSTLVIVPVAGSFASKDSRPMAARVRGLFEPGDWMRS